MEARRAVTILIAAPILLLLPRLLRAEGQTIAPTAIPCVDVRTGIPFSLWAQHLQASGSVDSTWTPDTTRLCLGSIDGIRDHMVPDGAGGAYVAWLDERRGDPDIYIQRLTSAGQVQEGWPSGGLPVCQAEQSQYQISLCRDGSRGVYIAWQDYRDGGAGRVYIQRLLSNGQCAPGWPTDGRFLWPQLGEQASPQVASDGSGGAWVVWQDRRSGRLGLYGLRIDEDGAPAAGWPAGGAALASGEGNELTPVIVSEAAGATTVIWRRRRESQHFDLLRLRLDPAMTPSGTLPVQPQVLSEAALAIGEPSLSIVSGGSIYAAWAEQGINGPRLRAISIQPNGSTTPGWPAAGADLGVWPAPHNPPAVLMQPDGGSILSWEDLRDSTGTDLYAMRLTSEGDVASGWALDGVPVVVAEGEQYAPKLASDNSGGAYVTWSDPSGVNGSVFALQRLPGGALELKSASATPGHARVVWQLHGSLPGTARALRRVEGEEQWKILEVVAPDDSGLISVDDAKAPEGSEAGYRLRVSTEAAELFIEPVYLEIPRAPPRLELRRAWASPAGVTVALALPRGAPAVLELIDVMGRKITRQRLGHLEPGEHQIKLGYDVRLRSGVYFVRLAQGRETRSAKVVLIR